MAKDVLEYLQARRSQHELAALLTANDETGRFGLTLTEEEARELIVCRNESLKRYERVEFGGGILNKLVFAFCDSQYINQENYADTLKQLQDIFYEFKNESGDKLTDDELIAFMREQYESVCFGDMDYLEGTCLERFAASVRAGYEGYRRTGGNNEYGRLSTEQRWDRELYLEVLRELCWR